MTDQPSPKPELDDAALAFAAQVFESARSGDAERLADLLGRGLPANIRNHNGDSLLLLASYHGHLGASRVLLENGADPQLRNDKGQSPLAGAAFKGNLRMARLLLDHGADVESASPDGKTALMMAAMFNVANALGPWLGGLAISAGLGWTSTGYIGAATGAVGLLVFWWAWIASSGSEETRGAVTACD